MQVNKPHPKPFIPKRRIWKLRDPVFRAEFGNVVTRLLSADVSPGPDTNNIWNHLKTNLLTATDEVCGWTKKKNMRKESWWWDESVNVAVTRKRRLFKAWRNGGNKEDYLAAKRASNHAVYVAKKKAEADKFSRVEVDSAEIFRIAKQMRRNNQDIVGEQCVWDNQGNFCLDSDAKRNAWKEYYDHLSNVEFPWDQSSLSHVDPVAGPAPFIYPNSVRQAVGKMKSGKAAGPSGLVGEMILAGGAPCVQIIADLANSIIRSGRVPQDWEESYIINLYKGKGDARERGNYRGLKLLDHGMKVVERVIGNWIRNVVEISDMQFGFMPGRGTTDAIFIARQVQEKFLSVNKPLYFAFVDLEKAFDRVPRLVLWWAMRKVGVDEWIVRLVQAMYSNARSRVRVGECYSDDFCVNVGVHQGSVLSPLLFIIVLEALSREFRTGCPWELLYADDLVIIAESVDVLRKKLGTWKSNMENKGLRVSMKKTKILFSGRHMNMLKDSGRWPCGVCRSGVGRNSIFCLGCKHWVHKKCSGIRGRLREDDSYRCSRCRGLARPIDGRPYDHIMLNNDKLEVVDSFCYLGDMIDAGGGCTLAIITRARTAWGKFRELLPILTNRCLSFKSRGRVFNTCVRPALLYGSECWAMRSEDKSRLLRNDRAMIRWICGVKTAHRTSTASLYHKLCVQPPDVVLRSRRLRWFGHVERSDSWIKHCTTMAIEGRRSRGRPRKTWMDTVRDDIGACNLTVGQAMDRNTWRRAVKATETSNP